MKKKKKLSDYSRSQKALLLIVIFGCFVPFTSAQGTKTNGFEDAAIDPAALNTDSDSEIQGSILTPVSSDKSDKGLVKIAEHDIEELITYRDETKTDDSLEVLASLTESDETSDINDDVFELDLIFNEIVEPSMGIIKDKDSDGIYNPIEHKLVVGKANSSSAHVKSKQPYKYNTFEGFEDWERGKRGALHLAGIIKCATNCNPRTYVGYGCFCGYLGAGEPMDNIDMCCKMHDWCYTTSDCHGLEWDLPYFVPFKWKCNGGAPYCIPGKTRRTGRNSCSHQLCECDREFAMCLNKNLPCPEAQMACGTPVGFLQSLFKLSPKKPKHHSDNKSPRFRGHLQSPHQQRTVSNTPKKSQNPFNPFKVFG